MARRSCAGSQRISIVTSELAPVGMLSALANDLHQSQAGAGLAVTAYGWVAALAALLAGAIPARISRKAPNVDCIDVNPRIFLSGGDAVAHHADVYDGADDRGAGAWRILGANRHRGGTTSTG